MATKSEQLQIRVTPSEKASLRRLAKQAGEDVSSYVLARVLPPQQRRFAELVKALEGAQDRRFVLAELNDLLSQLTAADFSGVVENCELRGLSDFAQNYLAAMVERAAEKNNIRPPRWVYDVTPLDTPWFATGLKNLRLHLLRSAPVAFKRRNLFVDSSVGDRV